MITNYKTIKSPSNPMIKEAIKIKKRSGASRDLFLIEGHHLIEMAIVSSLSSIKTLFFTEEFASKKDFQKILKYIPSIEKVLITEHLLSLLADTESPQGLIAIINYKSLKLDEIKSANNPLLIICDAIQDPGNIGTIIRAADAFGANAVVTLPSTCEPFNSKAIRATAGSIFNIPVIKTEKSELLKYLVSRDISIYATSSKAHNSIYEIDFNKPIALIFGNEAHGVSTSLQEKAKGIFKIPISGKAESINVAMTATACLYEAARQRNFFRLSYPKDNF